MSTGCTICVHGYPTDLPPDRLVDKLTIHFLRKRNGGGEIVDVEIGQESPDCAIITFEDSSVAQQVLEAKNHALSVNGRSYPLEVTAYSSQLNPNEVFVRVYMKIDYRRFPNGEDLLRSLSKQYKDIQLSFTTHDLMCSAKGPFLEMQAFSSELLKHLRAQPKRSVPAVHGKEATDEASSTGVLYPQEIPAKERSEVVSSASSSVKDSLESHTELLEDFSLVIDSDIHSYMQMFCAGEVRSILQQYQVGVVDVSSDGVTTLYLRSASEEAGSVRALVSTYVALSQLSQRLENSLQKEKISKGDLDDGGTRKLKGELRDLCPLLLIHEADEYLYLIGSPVEVSLAKQYIQNLIAARGASMNDRKPEVAQSTHGSSVHSQSSTLAQPTALADSAPKRTSLPRSNSKSEHRLAATFSTRNSFLGPNAPAAEQSPGGSCQAAERRAPNRDHALQLLAAANGSGSLTKAPVTGQEGPEADSELAPKEGTEPASLRHADLSSHLTTSSGVRPPNPFDSAGTVDTKLAEPRQPLRKPNHVFSQKPQSSGTSTTEPPSATDHVRQDTQPWSSSMDHLKQGHLLLQEEMKEEGMALVGKDGKRESEIAKQGLFGFPLAQREDEASSDLQRAGTSPVPSSYITESFSYSELAMEGPEDEALNRLCSLLRRCHDHVILRQDKYQLSLAYPREAKLKVLEAFHHFSTQRVAALTEQLFSHSSRQGGDQDQRPRAEAERMKGMTRADLKQNSVVLGREKITAQLPSSPDVKSLGQNISRNQNAWQSEDLGIASKQDLSGKSAAGWTLDKLHFLKEGHAEASSHGREKGPCSLPPLPLDFSVPAPKQAIDELSPSAKGSAASPLDLKPTDLRRTPSAEEGELCQSTGAVLPSTSKGYRTPVPSGSCSPSPRNASLAVPGVFGATTLSQSLHGYFRDPTLKITYDIPDGVQYTGNLHSGRPYQGGHFEAFLPDNPKGRRLMLLLRKAFERGLTFQIQPCGSIERVVWGPIPHKTSMVGGKLKNGYPDPEYLQHLSLKLKALDIE